MEYASIRTAIIKCGSTLLLRTAIELGARIDGIDTLQPPLPGRLPPPQPAIYIPVGPPGIASVGKLELAIQWSGMRLY